MSVGAIEGQFYKLFLEKLDLNPNDWPQFSESPEVRRRELANIFKTKNQDEWTQLFNGNTFFSAHRLLIEPQQGY